jgi:hypothetical protein
LTVYLLFEEHYVLCPIIKEKETAGFVKTQTGIKMVSKWLKGRSGL